MRPCHPNHDKHKWSWSVLENSHNGPGTAESHRKPLSVLCMHPEPKNEEDNRLIQFSLENDP